MSLNVCAIASGSKGNCFYISGGNTRMLIDLGISAARCDRCLSVIGGGSPDVVITHAHTDHVGGIATYAKKHENAHFYCAPLAAYQVRRLVGGNRLTVIDSEFNVGEFTVKPFNVSHDVPCVGYTVSYGGKRVGYCTDLGVITDDIISNLSECDFVVLESNHDPEMLKYNPCYSPYLKSRISSNIGHLSNETAACAAAELARRGVRNFMLAHLSDSNNYPELALKTTLLKLQSSGITNANVDVARQDEMSALYEIN